MTQTTAAFITEVFNTAVRKVRADYPDAVNELVLDHAWRRLEGACTSDAWRAGLVETGTLDARFAEELGTFVRFLVLDEILLHQKVLKNVKAALRGTRKAVSP